MHQLPGGTLTLLFTDIEGSTRLLRQVGDRYAEVLAECRRLLRQMFHEYGGHEVDTQGMPSSWPLRVRPMRWEPLSPPSVP